MSLSDGQQLARLNQQTVNLYREGRYEEAVVVAEQVVKLSRRCLGGEHPDFAQNLNNLAELYRLMSNYTAAEPLYQQALEIWRHALGEDDPSFATGLNNLALLYNAMGNYAAAESLYRQAQEIWRQSLGEQHPHFANSLNNLATLYQEMGNYAAAEPLYRQALEINRQVLGEEHPSFANSLNNLAALYREMGNYAAAEPLYLQALEIRRQALGEQHPSFVISLNNLAVLYQAMGNYPASESLSRQVLEIWRQVLGEEHPHFASSLTNLAGLYAAMGNYAAAEPLAQQALEIWRQTLGDQHPRFASSLRNLAGLYRVSGNYAAAEALYRQALEIWRKAHWEEHPDFAIGLKNLAGLCVATQREDEGLELLKQAAAIDDQTIRQIFSIGSESQRMAFLRTLHGHFDLFLSLVFQYFPNSLDAIADAMELVLRRKAIGAEALAAQRDAVLGGQYPELEPRLRQLTALRMQIAKKTLAGPGKEGPQAHRRLLAEWNAQKERFEAELARKIPEMNLEQELREVDRRVVAHALPDQSALVEFVRIAVFDFKAVPVRGETQWKPARYLAFIIPAAQPDNVHMIDLGEAKPIDKMIAALRSLITRENESRGSRDLGALPAEEVRNVNVNNGIDLREAVFDPCVAALGGFKRLLLAPDGDLTRLPFDILPTEGGRRLINDYHISYLSTGRDVRRFSAEISIKPTEPLLIADPDFDLGAQRSTSPAETTQPSWRQSHDLGRDERLFDRLPGTRVEGERIGKMLGAKPLLGGAALESRLKNYRSPRIVHMATHGFFLEDQKQDLNRELRGEGLGRLSGATLENPLLRSGLALAGVNTWLKHGNPPSEAEDGILTAEDVSGLDLLATEMVVLSACETGLGEIQTGEGVFGLRRAFVLAGARTLVMSLWKVPDQETQELMEDFYRRVLGGQPRADALREAQLAMMEKHPEPLYWGAFICQGDPSRLSGTN